MPITNYKPHKRPKMPLKLLGTLYAIVLSSCASPPNAPEGEKCVIWNTPPECLCVDSNTGIRTKDLTLEKCKGYIAVSPEYSQQIDEYIQQLRQMIRGHNPQ